jgi:hypothetical protein
VIWYCGRAGLRKLVGPPLEVSIEEGAELVGVGWDPRAARFTSERITELVFSISPPMLIARKPE